mgnify:CR=1 FL=1
MADITQSESRIEATSLRAPVPGVLLVFSDHAPQYRPVPLKARGKLTLGREDIGGLPVPDGRVGRAHAEVSYEGGEFVITDLGSRNGTFLDGRRFTGTTRARAGAVLRLAQTVLVLHDDLQRFITGQVRVEDGFVVGPGLQESLDLASMARRGGMHLLVHGETGTGKELVARTYHQAWTPRGPFVPVNASAIQPAMAERVLFGALRGAYTDAKQDQEGHFAAADGGVLFLDEIAEIDLAVQPRLLRAAQNGEVLPIGASTPRTVDVRIVSASHQNLRARVADGRFREGLLFRIASSEVTVLPLRQRYEELPWLMQLALGETPSLPLHATVVEAALLRPWPGNVRDLLRETKLALQAAQTATSNAVRAEHLRDHAGQPHDAAPGAASAPPRERAPAPSPPPGATVAMPSEERVAAALTESGGNVSKAAAALGLHRTQLNRLRKRYGLMNKAPAGTVDEGDDEGDEGA